MSDLFNGDGFSREPIEGQEAAQFRHIHHVLNREWGPLSDAVTVTRGIVILWSTIKIGGPTLLAMGALGAYLKTKGFL